MSSYSNHCDSFGNCSSLDHHVSSSGGLSKEWDEHEQIFQSRHKVLHRIADQWEDPFIFQYLFSREAKIRELERASFLLRRRSSSNEDKLQSESHATATLEHPKRGTLDDKELFFFDAVSDDSGTLQVDERLTFLRNRGVPPWIAFYYKLAAGALVNFFVHAWAYLLVNELWFEFRGRLFAGELTSGPSINIPGLLFMAFEFLLAFVLLRGTATFLWFASESVYKAIKFDLHNGMKLNEPIPKIMFFLRRNAMLSSLAFMTGCTIAGDAVFTLDAQLFCLIFSQGVEESTSLMNASLYDILVIVIPLALLIHRGFIFQT